MGCPKRLVWIVCATIVVGAMGTVVLPQGERKIHPDVSDAEWARWKAEYSNWGRWGKDDQLGTLNLITPAKRKEAAALVKEGIAVSIAHAALTLKDEKSAGYEITRDQLGNERMTYNPHGATKTHLDSLSHIFSSDFDGKGYNDYTPPPVADVAKNGGHARGSHLSARNGIFTRAVIFDIPRLQGLPFMERNVAVTVKDLEAWEKKAGVKVTAGDALLLRTGRWAREAKFGPWDFLSNGEKSGLDQSVVPWLRQRDVAIVGTDISNVPGAVHDFEIVILGVRSLDTIDLEEAADTAARLKRWEALLTMAPLAVNTTGSAINPILVF